MTRAGDWMVSFDLADGYYILCIREVDRDFFTVGYRGTLYKLDGLPMGWKCSSNYFCRLTEVCIRHIREPLPNPTGHNSRLATNQQPTRPTPSRHYLRNSRWRGARLLPYMDEFLFFAESRDAALLPRDRVACPLDCLGLGRNPKKATRSLRKFASTSASTTYRSTPQPLLSEALPRNYLPLLPSPGPYCNALHATHGGYLPGSS
jgi:hypothetical protein